MLGIFMPNGMKCFQCGSEKVSHQEVSMWGKHGRLSTKSFLFDVYICKDCNYTAFFLKSSKSKKKKEKEQAHTAAQSARICRAFRTSMKTQL
jgi:predicted nucleic-acid-binding Zn-ribbon protein